MKQEFDFEKKKLFKAIIVFSVFLLISVLMVAKPDFFLTNKFISKYHITFLGFGCGLLSTFYILSILLIVNRKTAIVVTKSYIIDQCRYESLGKIYWSEIKEIKTVKRGDLRLYFKDLNLNDRKISFFKKLLLFIANIEYKNSVIISSVWLKCSNEELEMSIRKAFENHNG